MRAHEAGWAHAAVSVRGPAWLRDPADVNALVPQLWSRTARKVDGVLEVGGVRLPDLVAEHGSPAYVLDEEDFRSRARDFRDGFAGFDVYYAGKAFLCTEVARWIEQEGLHLDVCTAGELAVAERAGFPMDRVELHGNNKSVGELRRAAGRHARHELGLQVAQVAARDRSLRRTLGMLRDSRRIEPTMVRSKWAALCLAASVGGGPVLRLAGLFALDSLAGGFVVQAWIAYWLGVRYGAPTSVVGVVFAAMGLLQAASFLAAPAIEPSPPITNKMSICRASSSSTMRCGSWAPREVPSMVPPCSLMLLTSSGVSRTGG